MNTGTLTINADNGSVTVKWTKGARGENRRVTLEVVGGIAPLSPVEKQLARELDLDEAKMQEQKAVNAARAAHEAAHAIVAKGEEPPPAPIYADRLVLVCSTAQQVDDLAYALKLARNAIFPESRREDHGHGHGHGSWQGGGRR